MKTLVALVAAIGVAALYTAALAQEDCEPGTHSASTSWSISSDCCHAAGDPHSGDESYRRVLWIVLAINAAMFAIEVIAGLAAGSASLQADALDFLSDTANYAMSLFVVGMTRRPLRSKEL